MRNANEPRASTLMKSTSFQLGNRRHERALQDNYGNLLADMDAKDVVPTLLARRVLNSRDMTIIYAQPTRDGRLNELVTTLKTKPNWWHPLMDALKRRGRGKLTSCLIGSLVPGVVPTASSQPTSVGTPRSANFVMTSAVVTMTTSPSYDAVAIASVQEEDEREGDVAVDRAKLKTETVVAVVQPAKF